MFYQFSCKDMGLRCNFKIKEVLQDDAVNKALEHIIQEHKGEFNNLHTQAELTRMKLALFRSLRVVAD